MAENFLYYCFFLASDFFRLQKRKPVGLIRRRQIFFWLKFARRIKISSYMSLLQVLSDVSSIYSANLFACVAACPQHKSVAIFLSSVEKADRCTFEKFIRVTTGVKGDLTRLPTRKLKVCQIARADETIDSSTMAHENE